MPPHHLIAGFAAYHAGTMLLWQLIIPELLPSGLVTGVSRFEQVHRLHLAIICAQDSQS